MKLREILKNSVSRENIEDINRERIYSLARELFGIANDDDNALLTALRLAVKDNADKNDMKKQYSIWKKQSESLNEIYPLFNLDECLSDRAFYDALRRGNDVRTAYEMQNRDRIIFSLMELAAEEAVARAAVLRKSTQYPYLTVDGDIPTAPLSRAKREEIIRRAAKGERIVL